MGIFDKLFGKGKKEEKAKDIVPENNADVTDEVKAEPEVSDETETAAEISPDESCEVKESVNGETEKKAEPSQKAHGISDEAAEKITAMLEMFPVKKDSVSPARSGEICQRFINNALNMGEELKVSDIVTLKYNELCVLYNTMQMMELKMDPKHRAIAENVIKNNKSVIRSRIITMLKKQTLYIIYTAMNKLPFVSNGAFYLYTDKELAEEQIKKSGLKYLGLKEVPEDQIELHFDVFYMTGYKDVIIDAGTKLPFSELYTPKENAVYGVINPVSCLKMIFFNQMTVSFTEKANEEKRPVSEEENKQINRVWIDITETLIHSEALLLPADKTEDGKVLVKGVSVKGPDGKNWFAMFTDQAAINMFFKANQTAAKLKNPILEQYRLIKNQENIEGIIINPGRESFRIPSKLLASRQVNEKKDEPAENQDN